MTQNNTFNPSEHLMHLKSKEGTKPYLPVQWRLVWFREQCPEGTIDTEELVVDLDREVSEEIKVWNDSSRRYETVVKHAKGYARYRAVVTDGKGGRASATKSENAASFADFCEKAETGAVGRALAMLGYGTQFTADELDEQHRIVDTPTTEGKSKRAAREQATVDAATLAGFKRDVKASGLASSGEEWSTWKTSVIGPIADGKLTQAHMQQLQAALEQYQAA